MPLENTPTTPPSSPAAPEPVVPPAPSPAMPPPAAAPTDISAQILALNSPTNVVIYQVAGTQITGTWNFQGQAAGQLASSQIDKDYSVTFTLDEAAKQYSFVEHSTQAKREQSVNPLAAIFSVSSSSGGFSGTQVRTTTANSTTSTTTGQTFGAHESEQAIQASGKPGENSYNYDFKPDQVKQPIIAILQQNGWSPRQQKGFFVRLFGKS